MRKLLLAATAAIALAAVSAPASAHPYNDHYAYRAPWRQAAPQSVYRGWGWNGSPWGQNAHQHHRLGQRGYYPRHRWAGGNDGRPAQCYGIAWCGCYLRSVLGIADAAFNLAIHWLHYGHAVSGPQVGAIAVGPHHVARIIGAPDRSGMWLIQDGNDGPVRVHRRSLAWAHWFRMG